ncbi:hypothetical protein D9M69_365720 [compost metagenome]
MAVDRFGRLVEEALQDGDGFVGLLFGAQLGGHQRGGLIARAQLQRLVERGDCARHVAGDFARARQRQVGFRQLGIVARQLLQQRGCAGGIAGARQLLLHLQDGVAAVAGGYGGQLLLQQRAGIVPASVQHQQRRQDLRCGGRTGRDFAPQPRRIQRLLRNARVEGNLGGTLREARVAGLPRQFEVGAVGRADQAALHGNLGRQHHIDDVVGQLQRGQLAACRLAGAAGGARVVGGGELHRRKLRQRHVAGRRCRTRGAGQGEQCRGAQRTCVAAGLGKGSLDACCARRCALVPGDAALGGLQCGVRHQVRRQVQLQVRHVSSAPAHAGEGMDKGIVACRYNALLGALAHGQQGWQEFGAVTNGEVRCLNCPRSR